MLGTRLDTLPPYKRRVNTVFQQYALFPHLNVSENVAYGLHAANTPKTEIPTRVSDALAMVRMGEYATAKPTNFPAASNNASRSPARSSIVRNFFSSTSRSPRWTPISAKKCNLN